jgi:CxC6 like cysteine cluster associated with KDZ transposases
MLRLTSKIIDGVSAGVTDGVETVRHVCCSIHDCTTPLVDQQDRFCPAHMDQQSVCCIHGCMEQIEPGHFTCAIESHRSFETARLAHGAGSALYTLRDRLRRAGVAQVPVAHLPSLEERSHANSSNTLPPRAHEALPKGRMSRRWTHNEQLFVRCCGVIISRATFFGSEGVTGVKVKVLYLNPPCWY